MIKWLLSDPVFRDFAEGTLRFFVWLGECILCAGILVLCLAVLAWLLAPLIKREIR